MLKKAKSGRGYLNNSHNKGRIISPLSICLAAAIFIFLLCLPSDGRAQCRSAGQYCSSSYPCCAGLTCMDGICQCTASGRACFIVPCCTGLTCQSGSCCVPSGQACNSSTPCCFGLTCKSGSCCAPSGQACSATSPCCAGFTCQSGVLATMSELFSAKVSR